MLDGGISQFDLDFVLAGGKRRHGVAGDGHAHAAGFGGVSTLVQRLAVHIDRPEAAEGQLVLHRVGVLHNDGHAVRAARQPCELAVLGKGNGSKRLGLRVSAVAQAGEGDRAVLRVDHGALGIPVVTQRLDRHVFLCNGRIYAVCICVQLSRRVGVIVCIAVLGAGRRLRLGLGIRPEDRLDRHVVLRHGEGKASVFHLRRFIIAVFHADEVVTRLRRGCHRDALAAAGFLLIGGKAAALRLHDVNGVLLHRQRRVAVVLIDIAGDAVHLPVAAILPGHAEIGKIEIVGVVRPEGKPDFAVGIAQHVGIDVIPEPVIGGVNARFVPGGIDQLTAVFHDLRKRRLAEVGLPCRFHVDVDRHIEMLALQRGEQALHVRLHLGFVDRAGVEVRADLHTGGARLFVVFLEQAVFPVVGVAVEGDPGAENGKINAVGVHRFPVHIVLIGGDIHALHHDAGAVLSVLVASDAEGGIDQLDGGALLVLGDDAEDEFAHRQLAEADDIVKIDHAEGSLVGVEGIGEIVVVFTRRAFRLIHAALHAHQLQRGENGALDAEALALPDRAGGIGSAVDMDVRFGFIRGDDAERLLDDRPGEAPHVGRFDPVDILADRNAAEAQVQVEGGNEVVHRLVGRVFIIDIGGSAVGVIDAALDTRQPVGGSEHAPDAEAASLREGVGRDAFASEGDFGGNHAVHHGKGGRNRRHGLPFRVRRFQPEDIFTDRQVAERHHRVERLRDIAALRVGRDLVIDHLFSGNRVDAAEDLCHDALGADDAPDLAGRAEDQLAGGRLFIFHGDREGCFPECGRGKLFGRIALIPAFRQLRGLEQRRAVALPFRGVCRRRERRRQQECQRRAGDTGKSAAPAAPERMDLFHSENLLLQCFYDFLDSKGLLLL